MEKEHKNSVSSTIAFVMLLGLALCAFFFPVLFSYAIFAAVVVTVMAFFIEGIVRKMYYKIVFGVILTGFAIWLAKDI